MNGQAPQNGSAAATAAAATNETDNNTPQDTTSENPTAGNGSHQPDVGASVTTLLTQIAGTASIPRPRPQMRGQRITEENAQSFFVSDALVFAGNLDRNMEAHELAMGAHHAVDRFGACHIQIKFSSHDNMPFGFIQFETAEAARAALEFPGDIYIRGRKARLEKGGGSSIAHIGYRNDNPITIPEIEELLHDLGHLREIHIVKDITAEHCYINYGTVNFTFYGDFANAVAAFRKREDVFLNKPPKKEKKKPKGKSEESMDNNRPYESHSWGPPPNVPPNAQLRGGYRGRGRGHWGGNGNGHGNGNGNGSSSSFNGGNGVNRGRGGYRNNNSHRSSFSSQHTNQSYNGQSFPSPNSPPQHYNGSSQYGSGFHGGNNLNQGYNPTLSPPFGNFPQGHVVNSPPQSFPQGYPPVGVFPSAPVFFSQAAEGPPVLDYAGMAAPGLPVFVPGPYPAGSLPPMMAQPQATVMTTMPPYTVGLDPYRAPPRLNEPLVVSSQPQYDTDRHKEIYYFPANDTSSGAPQVWIDPATGCYMHQDYGHHPTPPDYQYGQMTGDPSYPAVFPDGSPYNSPFAQSRLQSVESEDTERGRRYQGHHSMGDGGSDTPPAIPTRPPSEDNVADDLTQRAGSPRTVNQPTETHVEPTESQNEPNEPENDPKNPESQQAESTVPGSTVPESTVSESTVPESTEDPSCTQMQEEPQRETSVETQGGDTEHEGPEFSEQEQENLKLDTKSLASYETSDETPEPKTPSSDSEQPEDSATVDTAPQDILPSTVVAQPAAEAQSSSDPETSEEATPTKRDKGKSPAKSIAIADPSKPGVIEARSSLPRRNKPKHRKLKPQPKRHPKTICGKTMEQYTREAYAERLKWDPDFKFEDETKVEEAIDELEEEYHLKGKGRQETDHSSQGEGVDESKK